jgi:pimeloyl-ACP methyl ester carboxylesterase
MPAPTSESSTATHSDLMTELDRTFKRRKVQVGDVYLHYALGGQGDPVVLLHGWPQTWYMWRKVLLPLAQHYTVLAPDQRGSGDSDKPEAGYDAKTMAEDIRGLVDQLGFERFFVVGHDMGAPVAYLLAATHPDRVRGLVYIDEPLPGFNLEEFTRFSPDNPMIYWWYGFHSRDNLPETLLAGKERAYFDWFLSQGNVIADRHAISEVDKDEYMRTFAAPGGVRGAMGWYRAVFETGRQIQELAKTKLSIPVLGINGEFGHPAVGEQLKHVAENVSSLVIEDCGHFVAEEKPEKLVESLIKFFRSQ